MDTSQQNVIEGLVDRLVQELERAQSVTTTARGSVASTVVTYSHVASHSSPAVVQLVDTVTPSHSSVPVSEHLTRPTVLYQTSPSQSLPRTSKYSDQQFTTGQFSSHQQGQNPIPQQIVFPRLSVQDPSRLSSIQTVPQATQNKQPPPYYVLQSLLVNVDDEHQPSQQPQRSPLKQAQLSPVSTPVNASGQRPYSPQTSSVINKQSDLLKQLLVQNLLQQQQKQLQAEQQKQEPSQHHNLTVQQLLQQRAAQQKKEQLQQRCLTLQQLLQPQNKPVPTHTVQYRPHYTERSDLVEVSVPSKSPPPYHSIQRVPEVSGLSSDQASDSGGLSPMTLGTAEPSIPSEKMESRLGGFDTFINTCGDMPFSTEFIDASIYASSPNSLFMYDQEKIDMQSTLASCVTCSNVDKMVVSDDFELKTQYEISQDLRPISVTSASDRNGTFSSSYDGGGGQMWGDGALKSIKEDVMIKSESRSNTSAPTLAELNFNLDLLEDIETVISVDMNSCQVSAPRDSQPVIKQEPECTFNREQGSSLARQTQTQRTPELVYTKLVNAQPVPDTKVVVKTEPEEKDMKPSENGQFAPQVQTLTTSWFKSRSQSSNSQLTTVKQLDLSDARTLRHLLINERTASPVKIPRKRTVSESATLNSASRKRAYPTGESMDKKWEEIKQFIHMETSSEEVEPPTPSRQSPIKRERRRNFSECSAVTMTSNEDDESDSDRDIDDDSDSDLEDGHDLGSLNPEESLIGEKDKQYFWQYNVQSKGPKGTRAHFEMEEDPHFLNDFEDPVFDPTNNNMAGVGISIKHGGKARKGDGNDIVPSPKKLCQIGLQLRKINRQINDFLPVSELPSAARNKSRKEKNKLASRACRLKKKAQHEANKVKLHGLEMEHRQLLTVIRLMRRKLTERITSTVKQEGQLSMTETLEQQIAQNLTTMIGGNTTDYVNKIVHQVEAGDVTGGIHIKATRSYPKELHN